MLLGGLTGASPALAALVDQDWQSPGDAQLLLDTSTVLLWLDHTPTMDISYNDVTGALGTGGTFDGFRYATGRGTPSVGPGGHLRHQLAGSQHW